MSKCACRVREWFAEVVLNLHFQSQVARKYVRRKEQHKKRQRRPRTGREVGCGTLGVMRVRE